MKDYMNKLDIIYDPKDAIDYFNILKDNFQHFHWGYRKHHNEPSVIDPKNFIDEMNGWGLQTIYSDPSFPYHCDLDPHDEGPEYFKDTPMVFGFFKRLKDMLFEPYRSFLFNWPAGQKLGKWQSHTPPHVSIIVPVITNSQVEVIVHSNPVQHTYLEEGHIYLLDTNEYPAEFKNNSGEEITIIVVNVPLKYSQHVLNLTGTI